MMSWCHDDMLSRWHVVMMTCCHDDVFSWWHVVMMTCCHVDTLPCVMLSGCWVHDVMFSWCHVLTMWVHSVGKLCHYVIFWKIHQYWFKNLSNNLLKNPSKMFNTIFAKSIKIGFKNLSNCLLKNRLNNCRKQSVGTLCEYTLWVLYVSTICEYTMWVHYVSTLW